MSRICYIFSTDSPFFLGTIKDESSSEVPHHIMTTDDVMLDVKSFRDSTKSLHMTKSISDSKLDALCSSADSSPDSALPPPRSSLSESEPADAAVASGGGSGGLVMDTLKVKADLKVRSKFKTSWKEGCSGVSQNAQMIHLLNRLKNAIDAGWINPSDRQDGSKA